jgi:[acyl-carrier-protein] S-malonyltransferase
MSDNQTMLAANHAFIFPGQGSQTIGMLAEFADNQQVIETFEQASDALGYNLWELCQNGPAEDLNQTDKTQPALLTASVALWRVWQQKAAIPSIMAGHSLGEYSALVCAGNIEFFDAVQLVEKRGKFMQQSVANGAGKMAAIIGLDDDKVEQACAAVAGGQVVSPVNYNSPGQIVIAGNSDAVDRAMDACKDIGAKRAMPLAVSVPCHSLLIKPASEQLAAELDKISFTPSNIKVVNNVDVRIETEVNKIKDSLIRQLYSPVRWSETINFMAKQGVDHLVECGPGKVLSGLNRRIDRSLSSSQINQPDSLNQLVERLS